MKGYTLLEHTSDHSSRQLSLFQIRNGSICIQDSEWILKPHVIEVKSEFKEELHQITVIWKEKKTHKQKYDPAIFVKGRQSLEITGEKKEKRFDWSVCHS